MRKPDSLRTHLLAALPELQRDADRLLLFVDSGSVAGTFAPGGSFRYDYTLNLIGTDMAGDPDPVIYHLMQWVRREQPELLGNPARRQDIRFEVDVLANDKYDLSIKLPINEVVIVATDDGAPTFTNPPEDPPPWDWTAADG